MLTAVSAAALCAAVAVAAPAHADGSPDPNGSVDTSTLIDPSSDSALLNLLGQQGVRYIPVTASAAARDAGRPDATLVIDEDELAGADVLTELRNAGYGRVIILNNDPGTFDVFMPDVSVGDGTNTDGMDSTVGPACNQPDAVAAGSISLHGTSATFTVNGSDVGPTYSCYPIEGRPTVVYSRDGSSDVVALGSGTFFENDQLAIAGNAALALRLFGAHSRLVWFAQAFVSDPSLNNCAGVSCDSNQNQNNPQPGATTTIPAGGGAGGGSNASRPTLTSLMPSWIWWVLLQLLVAVLLVAYWRGRRLGAVVTEQLPVTVRAAETVEGHARLYRRANAHGRAAELLRRAAAGRLSGYFGVPAAQAHANPSVLVAPVAARLNVSQDMVAALLTGGAPQSEAELVQLADHLDRLEQEVRSS